MRFRRLARWAVILMGLISAAFAAFATDGTALTVPALVRFNGSLQSVRAGGLVGITFALYKDEQGGAPLWLETQNVTVSSDGRFSVFLGANHSEGLPAYLFADGEARWLGFRADGEEEQPRVLLVSVPYAMKAGDADTLGGRPASDFLLASTNTTRQSAAISDGAVLTSGTDTIVRSVTQAGVVSGSTNYVAKFSDATNLTNSTIFDGGGKIGIGTATPESILDIAANSSQTVRFGTVPWALRIGQLQAGTQFIGIAVTKTAANNNYIATSKNISTVNHTVLEFGYDGSLKVKQQSHQPDNTVLALKTSFGIIPNGNFGIGVDMPGQKLEVNGNVKISGTGNGLMFPDGTVQKTAATGSGGTGGTLTGVTAGTGLSGGGTSGAPVLSLNTSYTDARYAQLSAANAFNGNQSVGGDLAVAGNLATGPHVVTGDVAASGAVSATSVQAHVGAGVAGGIAISAYADSDDATGADVTAGSTAGTTTGLHATVNSPAGFAGIFDNVAAGNILLGRVKVGDYWVKKFRVDGNGRVYANAYSTGGADFAESFAVKGEREQYQPGDVLVVDRSGRRRLKRSTQAYSTLVAGVYSTRPGVTASPYEVEGRSLDQEVPLAVIGVVPCKVSAENGPIETGDLLVSASLPGYAMKGTDRARMLGAVIGKALESLESGTGVIEILVTLQ